MISSDNAPGAGTHPRVLGGGSKGTPQVAGPVTFGGPKGSTSYTPCPASGASDFTLDDVAMVMLQILKQNHPDVKRAIKRKDLFERVREVVGDTPKIGVPFRFKDSTLRRAKQSLGTSVGSNQAHGYFYNGNEAAAAVDLADKVSKRDALDKQIAAIYRRFPTLNPKYVAPDPRQSELL